jgi:alcohol dehydrogenase YqhD (iron-dependent ADH family)
MRSVAQNPGTKCTYKQYYQALTHAAERRDANALKEHGIGGVSKRKVYFTELGVPYQVDNYDLVDEVLAEMISYEVNAQARMNDHGY